MKNMVILWMLVLIHQFSLAQSKDEQKVLDLSNKKFRWLIQRQADSLAAVLDDRVMFIHSNGWSQSKQEMLDDMANGKLAYQQIDVKEASARLYNKSAVVVGTGRFSGEREGNEFDLNLRYTEVYVLKGKRWLLVSRHANRLP